VVLEHDKNTCSYNNFANASNGRLNHSMVCWVQTKTQWLQKITDISYRVINHSTKRPIQTRSDWHLHYSNNISDKKPDFSAIKQRINTAKYYSRRDRYVRICLLWTNRPVVKKTGAPRPIRFILGSSVLLRFWVILDLTITTFVKNKTNKKQVERKSSDPRRRRGMYLTWLDVQQKKFILNIKHDEV